MESNYQEALDKIKESLDLAIIKASDNLIGIEDTTHIGYINQMQELVDKEKALKTNYEKSIGINGATHYLTTCASCGENLNDEWNNNYCHNCGQKLDWSDEDGNE